MTFPILGFFPGNLVTPGSTEYTTPGTHEFVVPEYNQLIVTVQGAGAAGRLAKQLFESDSSANAANGTSSIFLSLVAGGGIRPMHSYFSITYTGGPGGSASGGDINQSGGSGQNGQYSSSTYGYVAVITGRGGHMYNTTNGGQGHTAGTTWVNGNPGGEPGGGGGGNRKTSTSVDEYGTRYYYSRGYAGGGAGGYVQKTYIVGSPSSPNVGNTINVTVGLRGLDLEGDSTFGGSGANGKVTIEWI